MDGQEFTITFAATDADIAGLLGLATTPGPLSGPSPGSTSTAIDSPAASSSPSTTGASSST